MWSTKVPLNIQPENMGLTIRTHYTNIYSTEQAEDTELKHRQKTERNNQSKEHQRNIIRWSGDSTCFHGNGALYHKGT
ncbi:uncharacterized [Tachysurus ichikawai]